MLDKMMAQVERFNREIIGLTIPDKPTRLSMGRKCHAHDHLEEELREFYVAETIEDEADALLDLAYVALGRLVEMGITVGPAFDEVQRANMERVRGPNRHRPNSAGFDAVKPEGWKAPDLTPFTNPQRHFHVGSGAEVPWVEHPLINPEVKWPGPTPIEDRIVPRFDDNPCNIVTGLSAPGRIAVPKPKVLVMGYGRHGKDTVGEILRDRYGMDFTSSSWFCAERVMMPYFTSPRTGECKYDSVKWCYEDRHRDNNRRVWYDAICKFNTPDPAALGRALFEKHDVYCGIRSAREFNALKNAGLFDLAVWVDRSEHEKVEDASSCTVAPWMADFVLDNNRGLDDLRFNLDQLMEGLPLRWKFSHAARPVAVPARVA